MGDINCKFWTPGALGEGQKFATFQKSFSFRTANVYIENAQEFSSIAAL
jgi:hypothetical protein